MSYYYLLVCKISAEKSFDSLMGVPLFITSCFLLLLLRFFKILIIMYLGMDLFFEFSVLPGPDVCFLPQVGKFSAIISSNNSSAPFSLSSLSWTSIMLLLFHLTWSHRSLKLFHLLKVFFFLLCLRDSYSLVFQVNDFFLIHLVCYWIPLVYFISTLFFSSVLSFGTCLFFFIALLKFSLHSFIFLSCSVSIFMVITFNSLSHMFLIYIS